MTDAQLKKIVSELKNTTDNDKKLELAKTIVKELALRFKPEAKIIVESIKDKPMTTRNHYGDYLQHLTPVKGMYRQALALALLNAGASYDGVNSAMDILKQ